jgi:hypothetical protein
LFLDDADRRRFLGAVAELPERYGLEIHAFVLMHNHVAVRYGRMGLAEVVRQVGLKDQAAAQAVKRFGQAMGDDPERQRFVSELRK